MIKTIKTQLFGSTNSKKIHPENRPNPTNSHPLSSKNRPKPAANGMPASIESANGKNPHIPPAKQSTETSPALRNCPKTIKSTEDSDPCYTIYLRCKDPSAYDYYKSSGAIH
jgi:hypothetical protein